MTGGPRLQSRGPVQEEALYIARAADVEVEDVLREGGLCVVLGPPGSGKSSLRVRVGRGLAKEGMLGAHLPLNKLPSATPAAFCLGFMQGLARALNISSLSTFFQRYAEEYGETLPAQRLEVFLRDVVLGQVAADSQCRVVLFFDDLDTLDGACAAALCSALYGVYAPPDRTDAQTDAQTGSDGEADEPELPNLPLGVCITSTTDPRELDLPLPPGAVQIYLPAFTRDELEAFTPALSPYLGDHPSEPLLDAVHDWTGGLPYLVQHLCQQLVSRGQKSDTETPEDLVEKLVETLFPPREQLEDPVLLAMERRMVTDRRSASLLSLWRRVWRGEAVHADAGDAMQRALFLCGLCTCPTSTDGDDEDGRIRTGGRIVGRLFDDEWARTQEARQLLRAAVVEGEESKLRGAALKTAQTWAVRNTETLPSAQIRALLICLEAARQEAEGRHQSSAAALQRETRERSELRAQWGREREELEAAIERAKWRTRGLAALCVILFLLSLVFGYAALGKRKSSSPVSEMSPAPSVMTRSPA